MNKILFLLIITLMLSCTGNKKGDKQTTDDTDSAITDTLSMIDTGNFEEFWKIFRMAVMNDNEVEVKKLCHFPVKAIGEMDHDPKLDLNPERFYDLFKKCLAEPTGMTMEEESNLDYIKATEKPEIGKYYSVQDDWCRVSAMEFQQYDGKWKLTTIYLNTEGMK